MNHWTKRSQWRENDSAWPPNQGDRKFCLQRSGGHREFVYMGHAAQHKMSMRETKSSTRIATESKSSEQNVVAPAVVNLLRQGGKLSHEPNH